MRLIKFVVNVVMFVFAMISTAFMLYLVLLALQMRP